MVSHTAPPPLHRCLHRQMLNQVSLCLTLLSVIPFNTPNQLSWWQLLHIYQLVGDLDLSSGLSSNTNCLMALSAFQKPDFLSESIFNKLCNLPVSEPEFKNVLQSMYSQQEHWKSLLQHETRYDSVSEIHHSVRV